MWGRGARTGGHGGRSGPDVGGAEYGCHAGGEANPATKKKIATAKKMRVPNMVGKNHQFAQDTLQAAGFYLLAEKDATGQGRMLIWDRNWVVVRQSPKGGTLSDPAKTTITLFSKKIGE